MKGNPTNVNRGLDCDVIVAEVRNLSHGFVNSQRFTEVCADFRHDYDSTRPRQPTLCGYTHCHSFTYST